MASRDEYVDAMKSTFVSVGNKAVLSWLVAQIPFFGMPVIKQISSYFVNLVLQGVVNQTETAIFFQYIDIRVSKQGRDFEAAAIEYHKLLVSGDKEAIANAEKNTMQKFKELIVLSS